MDDDDLDLVSQERLIVALKRRFDHTYFIGYTVTKTEEAGPITQLHTSRSGDDFTLLGALCVAKITLQKELQIAPNQ